MARNLIDEIIYSITEKPEYYKRVKVPPKTSLQKLFNPQSARQQQYNNWCKRYGVYNGSYLPEDPDLLLKKGWKETTSFKNKTGDKREFQRKSNNQMIRYDIKKYRKGRLEDGHYHWFNAKNLQERRNINKKYLYIDRYGETCEKDSIESHLAPRDKDYNWRK